MAAQFLADHESGDEHRIVNHSAHGMHTVMPEQGVPECAPGLEMVESKIAVQNVADRHRGEKGGDPRQVDVQPESVEQVEQADINQRDRRSHTGKADKHPAIAFGAVDSAEEFAHGADFSCRVCW